MPTTRTFLKSFSSGEISPEMLGRIDDSKYQQGAATMRNFIALPQGPAENRSGFQFVAEVKDSTKKTRLIPFRFNIDQTMVIEIGHEYFRFHSQGSPVKYTEPTEDYSIGSVEDPNRKGDIYKYTDPDTNEVSNVYINEFHGGVGLLSALYTLPTNPNIFEIPSPYQEAELFDIKFVQSGDIITLVHPNHEPRELKRIRNTSNNPSFILDKINFTATISAPTISSVVAHLPDADNVGEDTKELHTYVVTAVASDGIQESAASNPRSVSNNIFITGANNTILWNEVTDALRYRVYKEQAGLFGFIGETNHRNITTANAEYATTTANSVHTLTITEAGHGLNTGDYIDVTKVNGNITAGKFRVTRISNSQISYVTETDEGNGDCTIAYVHHIVDNNIAPDFSVTPPIYESIFNREFDDNNNPITDNFPSAVSYYEQRRVFAGTNNEPQTIFMTRSGTESDMSFKLPIRDDDRIKFKVAAREANRIKHIVPLTQLLFLTEAAEWRVTSVNSDAITPTSVSVKPQSYIGANNSQPVIVNNSMVYVASRGGHVRELGYNWQANGFITGDLSIRASHLFDGLDITDIALAKAPVPIVWMVSTNGKLLGLTYVPEQQVGAWHQHDTDGTFESVAAVAEGNVDSVYCVIKRTINNVEKRYIERMGTRKYTDPRDSFFVDSGRSYDGTNVVTTDLSRTVKIQNIGSNGYTTGENATLTVTASVGSADIFKFNNNGLNTDVDDAIVLVDGTESYRVDIVSITDATTATVKINKNIPSSLQNTATSNFEIAEKKLFGLSHLVGKTVSILADGAVHPTRVVDSNGGIVLNRAASVVHIGLPYTCDLQTLPLLLQVEAGGQGRVKNINHAWLRVFKSSGIFIGPSKDKLVEAKQRTTEPFGLPPALKTEDIKLMLTPTWADNGQIFVRQTDPLPLTIVGVTLEVSIGG
tara:strand:- start:1979 stop:4783 length:2805 start_codon:yes stop_codon:yes gene_type:complete